MHSVFGYQYNYKCKKMIENSREISAQLLFVVLIKRTVETFSNFFNKGGSLCPHGVEFGCLRNKNLCFSDKLMMYQISTMIAGEFESLKWQWQVQEVLLTIITKFFILVKRARFLTYID